MKIIVTISVKKMSSISNRPTRSGNLSPDDSRNLLQLRVGIEESEIQLNSVINEHLVIGRLHGRPEGSKEGS
jgi:hypothetical protein